MQRRSNHAARKKHSNARPPRRAMDRTKPSAERKTQTGALPRSVRGSLPRQRGTGSGRLAPFHPSPLAPALTVARRGREKGPPPPRAAVGEQLCNICSCKGGRLKGGIRACLLAHLRRYSRGSFTPLKAMNRALRRVPGSRAPGRGGWARSFACPLRFAVLVSQRLVCARRLAGPGVAPAPPSPLPGPFPPPRLRAARGRSLARSG
jgi:hypothetical protein